MHRDLQWGVNSIALHHDAQKGGLVEKCGFVQPLMLVSIDVQDRDGILEFILDKVHKWIEESSVVVSRVGVPEDDYAADLQSLGVVADQTFRPIDLVLESVYPVARGEDSATHQIETNKERAFVLKRKVLGPPRLPLNVKGMTPRTAFKAKELVLPKRQSLIRIWTVIPVVISEKHKDWSMRQTQYIRHAAIVVSTTRNISVAGVSKVSDVHQKFCIPWQFAHLLL